MKLSGTKVMAGTLGWVFTLALSLGCSAPAPESDPAPGSGHEAPLDPREGSLGKADDLGFSIADQCGMLSLANSLDADQLSGDVGLHRTSANSLVSYRAGADDTLGTDDDQFIDSIEELDAVYWIGPVALGKLGDHVSDNALSCPRTFRLVNWNVENLFNDKDDSDTFAPETILDPAEYAAKLQATAPVIRSLDADVFVLPEVENQAVADDLAEAAGDFEQSVVSDGNDPRGIDIAVMSRLPILRVKSHAGSKFQGLDGTTYKFSRDCFEVHLVAGAKHVIVLGVHLKAMIGAANDRKREAEGQQIRRIALDLEERYPEALLFVVGDFNTTPDSLAQQYIVGDTYTNVSDFVPEDWRYSYVYKGDRRMIDNQILNPRALEALFPNSVYMPHSEAIESASDHYPISVKYRRF